MKKIELNRFVITIIGSKTWEFNILPVLAIGVDMDEDYCALFEFAWLKWDLSFNFEKNK